MNSLKSVRTLLIEHLNEAPQFVPGNYNVTPRFVERVYYAFSNLIADSSQSPESIIHKLDTFISGLDGFSENKCIQSMVAFACFEGVARRRPKALSGSWETLIWGIVKYSSLPTIYLGRPVLSYIRAITDKNETLQFIIDFCTPKLCPNPCLRLELLRFLRIFNNECFHDKSLPRKIMNTIYESCDYYKYLTIDQVPNVTPRDLEQATGYYGVDMGYIMDNYDLEMRNSKLIPAFLSLTRKLALLGKEKPQSFNNEANLEDKWNDTLRKQLSACLSIGGLIPEYSSRYKEWLDELMQVVAYDYSYVLRSYMIDILDTITQLSLSLPHNIIKKEIQNEIARMKDKLHNEFVKVHVKTHPIFQNLYEIDGGIVPSEEYTLRCYQNNVKVSYINSDSDSDSISSDMNECDCTDCGADSEESDWETDISE